MESVGKVHTREFVDTNSYIRSFLLMKMGLISNPNDYRIFSDNFPVIELICKYYYHNKDKGEAIPYESLLDSSKAYLGLEDESIFMSHLKELKKGGLVRLSKIEDRKVVVIGEFIKPHEAQDGKIVFLLDLKT